jgi:hypothetical protein
MAYEYNEKEENHRIADLAGLNDSREKREREFKKKTRKFKVDSSDKRT